MSTEKALNLLRNGQALNDVCIEGKIEIETSENWNQELIIENCEIHYFSGSVTQFEKPVKLINCHFKNCQFVFTYFSKGLTIENCIFDSYLDFQAGGHNKAGYQVNIINNNFKGFVNFFDCWYESEVKVTGNEFKKGTNLLGKPFNIPVTFDKGLVNLNNTGQLDIDNEGKHDVKEK